MNENFFWHFSPTYAHLYLDLVWFDHHNENCLMGLTLHMHWFYDNSIWLPFNASFAAGWLILAFVNSYGRDSVEPFLKPGETALVRLLTLPKPWFWSKSFPQRNNFLWGFATRDHFYTSFHVKILWKPNIAIEVPLWGVIIFDPGNILSSLGLEHDTPSLSISYL